jgi:hypothetical protein
MTTAATPEQIAEALGRRIWGLARTDAFRDYLAAIYGRRFATRPQFEKLYVAEAERGNLAYAGLHGMARWWEIDDSGFRPSQWPNFLNDPDNPLHARAGYYITPFIRFYVEGTALLLGETYGPTLISRQQGTLSLQQGQVEFTDQRVVWIPPS